MNLRRPYSTISLTSLLDVVFLTLFLLVLAIGDEYRTTNLALGQREQAAAITATVALAAAEETVSAIQSAAQATSDAMVAASSRSEATTMAQAQTQAATATSVAAHLAQQEEALATSETRLMTLGATATTAAQQARTQATALYATPVAVHANAQATLTIVARQADQRVAAAQATTIAAQATTTVALTNAAEVQRTTEAESMAAQELYQDAQQILAAEVTDPGLTIAKARWVDKYATFYLIRLSPYVEGRSTLEMFRGGIFLGSRQINSQTQIRDFLTALDRSDVADTLVILTFSPDSSDNHRQWILEYLDSYNFKYQRLQEVDQQVSE